MSKQGFACPYCDGLVSPQAQTCPHCGEPLIKDAGLDEWGDFHVIVQRHVKVERKETKCRRCGKVTSYLNRFDECDVCAEDTGGAY